MLETLLGFLMMGSTVVYAAPQEQTVYELKDMTIEERVRKEFADAPEMIEIARCESQFRNVPSKTGDYGVFQINQVHLERLEQLGLDRTKVEDNIRFARILYDEKGTQPWYMSKHCWSA